MIRVVILTLALVATACTGDDNPPPAGLADAGFDVPEQPDVSADRGQDAEDVGADAEADARDADRDGGEMAVLPAEWMVTVYGDAEEAVGWAADDVVTYFSDMGLTAVRGGVAEECATGVGRVVFDESTEDDWTDQTFSIQETRCDGPEGLGIAIVLRGGGLFGRQYAAYEMLHQLGVRFFHPEETFVPQQPVWPDDPMAIEITPAFTWRSASLHLTHPLEIGDPIRLGDEDKFPEVVRYIDWSIRNGASIGRRGIGTGELADYGQRRGFPREAGFSLHNQQQGASAIIDPDDPRPWQEQLAEAIDERMSGDPTPSMFSFTFNPSEFTEIEDTVAVEQLTFIADYIGENYPDTSVLTTNHGTAQPPTENYGVRYFDLPKFAPPNLGVKVHTLMFYDLFRPAPVYGNENFNFLFDFMVEEYQTRQLWYFPEAAWWLTFDIPVPLYLPITIEARYRDIQGLAFMLEGKLDGHRVFGTGHEWGYWQNEYCSYRMAMDLNYGYRDCVADIASATGPPAAQVAQVLELAIDYQIRDIIYGDILAYLVGTDPETEIAAAAGIEFHPLPPSPRDVQSWTVEDVERFDRVIAPRLERMATDNFALVERLNAVESEVGPGGGPWFREIRDGIEANAIRARHQRNVYGALVTYRRGVLMSDPDIVAEAFSLLEAAEADTEAILEVVRRREADYRYQPVERAIAGGPDGTEDDNWTVYGYRYLNRTHHAYYYVRIDQLVREALEGAANPLSIVDAMLGPGEDLVVNINDPSLAEATLHAGDGEPQTAAGPLTHTYDAPGVYDVEVTADQSGTPVSVAGRVAKLEWEVSALSTPTVTEPAGASIIAGLLPGVVFGGGANVPHALGFAPAGAAGVGLDAWSLLEGGDAADMTAGIDSVDVPLFVDGDLVTTIIVTDLVVTADDVEVAIDGNLSTQAVVDALVSIGGFDEPGARAIVAMTLGFTSDTLPAEVPFAMSWTVDS